MVFTPLSFLLALFAGSVTLFLPGLAWQAWVKPIQKDPLERLADMIGVSIAVNALFALIFFMVDIQLTTLWLLGIYLILLLATIIGFILQIQSIDSKTSPLWYWLLALGSFGIMIAWRLYQARDLVLPAWVDSLHHVLIVRKFLEYGGLPSDLNPYLPVPFFYHYAFHSMTALFAYWARLSPDQSVLIFGQILNAAVCLSIYRLVKSLWGDVRRAGAAAFLAALFSHMPAYYLTWGRYTLITGLILLPLAMASALEISGGAARRRDWIHLAILTAGVLLAHYLAALLLALFFIVLALQHLWQVLHDKKISWQIWGGLVTGSLGGLVLATPWLLRVLEYSRSNFRIETVIDGEAVEALASPSYLAYLWQLLGPQRNHFLILLGVLGLLLALRTNSGRLIAAWSILIALLSLPWGLRLGPFRPDHFTIVLFLPLVILSAGLLVSAGEALGQIKTRTWEQASLAVLALGFGIWGVKETRNILNPVTILADTADLQALSWIAENTPEDARFLINVVPWQGGSYRGVDGGAWILPLTGRWSLIPTEIYVWGTDGYGNDINQWVSQAYQFNDCNPELWSLIEQASLDYIYLKEGSGSLQPDHLFTCEGMLEKYVHADVTIFQINPLVSGRSN